MKNIPLFLLLMTSCSPASAQAFKELTAIAGTSAEPLPAIAAVIGVEAPAERVAAEKAMIPEWMSDLRACWDAFSGPADKAALAKTAGRWKLIAAETYNPFDAQYAGKKLSWPQRVSYDNGALLEIDGHFNDFGVTGLVISDKAGRMKDWYASADGQNNIVSSYRETHDVDAHTGQKTTGKNCRDWYESYTCRIADENLLLCRYTYGGYEGCHWGDADPTWYLQGYIRVYSREK